MTKVQAINSELMQCHWELSRLLNTSGESDEPLPPKDVDWWRQVTKWRSEAYNPNMYELYQWFVRTPKHTDVLRYMAGIFDRDKDDWSKAVAFNKGEADRYRYMQLNFLGSSTRSCIADLFYWYHKKIVARKSWLIDDSSIDRGRFTAERYVDTNIQWYSKFSIGDIEVQFTWRVLSANVLEVIFTRNTALYDSADSWEKLRAMCTEE
jgi:hypothetical protein